MQSGEPCNVGLPKWKNSEELIRSLRGRIAVVGNGNFPRNFGDLIDKYDVVIRINNYRISGFEKIVGSRTDFRCTSAWRDIERRPGVCEFSPFTAYARESRYLKLFNQGNHCDVLTTTLDVHPLITETKNPSTGLSLIQLLHTLDTEADVFGFDGFATPHYWTSAPQATSHSKVESQIYAKRGSITMLRQSCLYEHVYEHCHRMHKEYSSNVGLQLIRHLKIALKGKSILEFGAGNGDLAAYLEASGNKVTAFEVAPTAFEKIRCFRKYQDTGLGLPFLREHFDLFISVDVLEHLTEDDVRLVLREAARLCSAILISVSIRPSGLLGPNCENLHLTVRSQKWWLELVSRYFDATVSSGHAKAQLVIQGVLKTRPCLSIDTVRECDNNFANSADYFLPASYQSRARVDYFLDSSASVWQPDVYPFAAAVARELNAHELIDVGCGRAGKLMKLSGEFRVVGIDHRANLDWCRRRFLDNRWIDADFESPTDWPPVSEGLSDSVLICADVVEHLVNPRPLLRQLKHLLSSAQALVISTPERNLERGVRDFGPPRNPAHAREWSIEEFIRFMLAEGFKLDYAGLTRSNDQKSGRRTILIVAGNSEGSHYDRLRTPGSELAKDICVLSFRSWLRKLNAINT